ncbi:MAG: ribosome maturation factor RimP [bacterium]
MWSDRAKDIFNKLEPLANSMGLKIVELDVPAGQNGIFRVYLDTISPDTKITVAECSRFSPIVSDYLDTEDFFPFRYYLEVSSPGLDRPYRKWEDLHSAIGKTLKIKLSETVDNRRRITGVLLSVSNEKEEFTVEVDGTQITIAKGFVKKINEVWKGENDGT